MLLGGSSVAGSGAERNDQTIAAQLEVLLNERERGSGYVFQVLNFGGAGGYTGAELIRFLTQLIYFEPDMIISVDGFNDAWNAALEHRRVGLDHPIINWSDFSYRHFEVMNGYHGGLRGEPGFKVLTYSSVLVSRVIRRVRPENRRELYETLPLYRESASFRLRHPHPENVIYSSLDAFAAYAAQHRMRFLAYLQPHAMQARHLTDRERAKVESFFTAYAGAYSEAFRMENYLKAIPSAFDAYGEVYRKLGEKDRAYRNVRFVDLRGLFSNVAEDVYADVIHYTPYGNHILAERFYADIREILPRRA